MAAIDVGVGLPSHIEGVTRVELINWARRAEDMGASTLACTDRVEYPSLETILTLAAVSSVTERARLMASVLVAPLRTDSALFRKQITTLDLLTDQRLVLGLGVGRRMDDYDACHVDYSRRGKILDDQLHSGNGQIGRLLGGRLLFGGQGPATLGRIARHGGGWVAAAGLGAWHTATAFASDVRGAWTSAGRPGTPRLVALIYVAAGPHARDDAFGHMRSYYGFLGEQRADELAGHVITDPGRLAETRDQIAEAGFDEVLLLPTSADPIQLEALKVALV